MLNRVTVMGRLSRDPELRHTQSGIAVLSFSLAVDRDFKDKQTGERATDWINCVAWRNTANFIAGHFSKGRMIALSGRLQSREYTDRDGNKRYTTEILVDSAYFADSKRESGYYPAPEGNANESELPPVEGEKFSEILEEDESDIPF